jgi:hypothetical protein
LSRVTNHDQEVGRINGSAPAGEHRRLLEVELTARGLANFNRMTPSILEALQVPDFSSGELLWPPPRRFDMSFVAPVPFNPRYSADWWRVKQEEERAAQERLEREEAEEQAKRLATRQWG